jgi:hypothetical protein
MPVVVVISKHLLNVFVQLANKSGLKKIILLTYSVALVRKPTIPTEQPLIILNRPELP